MQKSLYGTAAMLALALSTLLGVAGTAQADESGKNAVWKDAEGAVWKNVDGECWRKPGTPSDEINVECGDEPPDSDGDGVNDRNDACPDTPSAATVGNDGCPLDSDGDGVADYQDECQRTEQGARVDDRGCQLTREVTVTQNLQIQFATNRAEVRERFYPTLRDLAQFMRNHPDATAEIVGHTDNVGAADYNQQLSQRRAEAVVGVLVDEFGIAPRRLEAIGYGESRPKTTNETAAGRAENRRVEAKITATERRRVDG